MSSGQGNGHTRAVSWFRVGKEEPRVVSGVRNRNNKSVHNIVVLISEVVDVLVIPDLWKSTCNGSYLHKHMSNPFLIKLCIANFVGVFKYCQIIV